MELSKDEIIRIAREAGLVTETHGKDWIDAGFPDDCLFDFAALVAAHEKKFWMEQIEVECNEAVLAEREACAKVCDKLKWHSAPNNFAENCAAAIRARGE